MTNNITLSNDLVSDVYVGTDEKIHIIKGGADSVLPFNKAHNIQIISEGTYNSPVHGIVFQGYVLVNGVNIGSIGEWGLTSTKTVLGNFDI